jgi:ribosomal protein S12 methylthiotransferase
MRGGHRSTPIEELVESAKKLAAKGVKELILIAQDLTYYGLDIYKERKLAELLRHLSGVEGIEWIRLHYAFPSGFPMDVLDVMRDTPNICNYIDIPLQHASNAMLKSMKRGTTLEKTNKLLAEMRSMVPGIAIRTTLITGYPGESEEDFQIMLDWVKESRFDRLGVFTYSHEEQTSAFDLVDDVPQEVKQERANMIMDAQRQISLELNEERIGSTYRVLFDRAEGGHFIGRTEFDSPEVDNEILIPIEEDTYVRIGDYANVLITSAEEYDLFGKLVD